MPSAAPGRRNLLPAEVQASLQALANHLGARQPA